MATHPYFLLVLTVLILPIECNSDLYSVLNTDDGHLSEPPAYKYSEQGNIKPFINMTESNLLNNNIFLSILSINLIPILLLFSLTRIPNLPRHEVLLTIFLSFTSGGLLANVFLRLIPYIIETKNVHHQQHENHMGLFILTGVFLSFTIEKFIRNFQKYDEETNPKPALNALAYIFLLADILNNYTNNLNLSSVLLMKSTINSNMMITVMINKTLQVLYGYTILFHAGWNSWKAMRFQLLTGLIGLIVCLISLQFPSYVIVELWSNQIVLPIMAGIVVYISTVHIIPEVIENNSGIKGNFFKITICIVNVVFTYYLKTYE